MIRVLVLFVSAAGMMMSATPAIASGAESDVLPTPANRLAIALGESRTPFPISVPALPTDDADALDTLHWDGPNDNGLGFTQGGNLYGAARFTPTRDYASYSILWFCWSRTSAAEVYIWGPGTVTSPGELLATITSPVGENTWIEVATPTIALLAGEDFWVGVRVTHAAGQYPLGVDDGPAVRDRGGFWSGDGRNWNQLHEGGIRRNWNIRAVVGSFPNDVGVTTILAPTGTVLPGNLTPQVGIRNSGRDPQSNIPVQMMITDAGAEVYSVETVHPGPLAPGASAVVSFSPDWDAVEGSYAVTSWTALADDQNPANDTMRTTVDVTWQVRDTLLWDSGATGAALGLIDETTFYGAVRFTPEQNYTLTNVLWQNWDRAVSADVMVWGPGSSSAPGILLETIESEVGEETLINVATPPVDLPPGQDFWVGVRVNYDRGKYPLGMDAGPQVRERGGFISSDGQNWNELYLFDPLLDFNWVIRAVVYPDVGIESEPVLPVPSHVLLGPSPLVGGIASLRLQNIKGSTARITVFDVTGREVFRSSEIISRQAVTPLDLRGLGAGLYIVQVETTEFTARQKLVVQ